LSLSLEPAFLTQNFVVQVKATTPTVTASFSARPVSNSGFQNFGTADERIWVAARKWIDAATFHNLPLAQRDDIDLIKGAKAGIGVSVGEPDLLSKPEQTAKLNGVNPQASMSGPAGRNRLKPIQVSKVTVRMLTFRLFGEGCMSGEEIDTRIWDLIYKRLGQTSSVFELR
jgi:hypothetical protein